MKRISHKAAVRLATKALAHGGERTGLTSVRWDIAPRCADARCVELVGRPDPKKWRSYKYRFDPAVAAQRLILETRQRTLTNVSEAFPIFVELWTKCRNCTNCLREKAHMWQERAKREITAAERTWFGTFTLHPDTYTRYLNTCRVNASNNLEHWEYLSDKERSKRLCAQFGKDLTKFFKRLRFNTGAKIRYLLVSEEHKSGVPHFHALIHQVSPDGLVRKRDLEQCWNLGFTKFKLVDETEKAARYTTKYVTKDARTRIRASNSYGTPPTPLIGHVNTILSGGVLKRGSTPPSETWPCTPPPQDPSCPQEVPYPPFQPEQEDCTNGHRITGISRRDRCTLITGECITKPTTFHRWLRGGTSKGDPEDPFAPAASPRDESAAG